MRLEPGRRSMGSTSQSNTRSAQRTPPPIPSARFEELRSRLPHSDALGAVERELRLDRPHDLARQVIGLGTENPFSSVSK